MNDLNLNLLMLLLLIGLNGHNIFESVLMLFGTALVGSNES